MREVEGLLNIYRYGCSCELAFNTTPQLAIFRSERLKSQKQNKLLRLTAPLSSWVLGQPPQHLGVPQIAGCRLLQEAALEFLRIVSSV